MLCVCMRALGLCGNRNGRAAVVAAAAPDAFRFWLVCAEQPRQGLVLVLLLLAFEKTCKPISVWLSM